jgi:hypothetical protein
MVRCDQCGSSTLVLAGMSEYWSLRCKEGHPWIADSATIIVIDQGNSDLDDAIETILERGG